MADKKQTQTQTKEAEYGYESESGDETISNQQLQKPVPAVNQQVQQPVQQQQQQQQQQHIIQGQELAQMIPPRAEGYRPAAIRESRIKDRPYRETESSLKIKIELDLEVEVDLYARVKGDVTIGLM